MKEYVFHIVQNHVNPVYTEFDKDSYYRCNATNKKDAVRQVEENVPELVFFELIKVNA